MRKKVLTSQNGFSLIELVAVVAFLGIVALGAWYVLNQRSDQTVPSNTQSVQDEGDTPANQLNNDIPDAAPQ